MDTRPSGNPILPDHINNKNEHPLKDFLILSLAVVLLISLFTWLLAASASWLAPKIPYEWELSWKGDSHLTTEDSTEPHEPQEQQEQALQQLLQKLVGDNALPVQVHYLADEETPNAFATLGGHIFITRGLLENIRSENGLAMVLAHEYAHIQLRHPMTLLLEQLSLGVLWALMGSDNMAQTVTQSTSLLTLLAFSRDMERDADQFALQRLSATYGHTAGADEFFTQVHQLEQESSLSRDSEWLEFVQTHPITDERIQTIRGSMQAGTTTALPTLLNIQ